MHPVVRAILQGGVGFDGILYNVGDERTAATGGWTKYSFGSGGTDASAKNADNLFSSLANRGGGDVGYSPANAIDLTPYSKLKFRIDWSTTSATLTTAGIYILNSAAASRIPALSVAALKQYYGAAASGTNITDEIDISALNGSKYIYSDADTGGSGTATLKLYEMWLE
jgi:hypothetical protein